MTRDERIQVKRLDEGNLAVHTRVWSRQTDGSSLTWRARLGAALVLGAGIAVAAFWVVSALILLCVLAVIGAGIVSGLAVRGWLDRKRPGGIRGPRRLD